MVGKKEFSLRSNDKRHRLPFDKRRSSLKNVGDGHVLELADRHVLGTCDESREGSTPSMATTSG